MTTLIICENPKCPNRHGFYWESDLKETKKEFRYCPYCGGNKLKFEEQED